MIIILGVAEKCLISSMLVPFTCIYFIKTELVRRDSEGSEPFHSLWKSVAVVCLISICAFGKSPYNWLNICTIGCGHGGTMWLSIHLFSWTETHWQQTLIGRNSPGLVYISWGCWGQNHKGKERRRISRNKKNHGNKWALFQHLNGLSSFIKRLSSGL